MTTDTTRFLTLINISGKLTSSDWEMLDGIISAWAKKTTNATSRRWNDLLRDKQRTVYQFFKWVRKRPHQVTPADVAAWQEELRELRDPKTNKAHYAPATIYSMVSKVSSFYSWSQKNAKRANLAIQNPVDIVRTKAPKAYQNKSAKALTDDEVQILVATIKARASTGDIVGKRDYAMLLLYLVTGLRREEIAQLKWGDVKMEGDSMLLSLRMKGGDIITRELLDKDSHAALMDYLQTSDRLRFMKQESPLWTRHDRAGKPGATLTSHAFSKNMKQYAIEAGLEHFHLHQTRHTYARIVAEDTGSIIVTQDALDHANPNTTRVYVKRIGIKRDHHSAKITSRLRATR